MGNKDVMNIDELCGFLSMSRAKIYGLKKEGLPYYKIGKMIRFNKNSVLEWLEKYQTSDKK